jgi:hypothetical protein
VEDVGAKRILDADVIFFEAIVVMNASCPAGDVVFWCSYEACVLVGVVIVVCSRCAGAGDV